MQLNGHVLFPAALLLTAFFVVICEAQPVPLSGQPSYYNEIESEPDPETIIELLARLEQSLIRSAHENPNTKRGMDLGLSRGYSGSMTAKHLMGLASANYAGGPGRRRRSASLV